MVWYFFSRNHSDSVYYKHTNLHVPLVYLQPLDSRDQLSVLVTEKKIWFQQVTTIHHTTCPHINTFSRDHAKRQRFHLRHPSRVWGGGGGVPVAYHSTHWTFIETWKPCTLEVWLSRAVVATYFKADGRDSTQSESFIFYARYLFGSLARDNFICYLPYLDIRPLHTHRVDPVLYILKRTVSLSDRFPEVACTLI